MLIVSYYLPGVKVDDYQSALLVAVALAFLNALVKPVLTVLTIPVTLFSFGLFLLVINGFMIVLAEKLVPGFHVHNFWWAVLFSLILSLLTAILNAVFGVNGEPEN